jgi:hypothetical protein
MKLPSWKKIAALAFLAASPLMIASDEMETPCIDETTQQPCWDVVKQFDFYYILGWPTGPSLGSCYTCIQWRWNPKLGSTFTGVVPTTTEIITCTAGTPVGSGTNRSCATNQNSPTVLLQVQHWGGIGSCNNGLGCGQM